MKCINNLALALLASIIIVPTALHPAASPGGAPIEQFENALTISPLAAANAFVQLRPYEQSFYAESLVKMLLERQLAAEQKQEIFHVLKNNTTLFPEDNQFMQWLQAGDVQLSPRQMLSILQHYSHGPTESPIAEIAVRLQTAMPRLASTQEYDTTTAPIDSKPKGRIPSLKDLALQSITQEVRKELEPTVLAKIASLTAKAFGSRPVLPSIKETWQAIAELNPTVAQSMSNELRNELIQMVHHKMAVNYFLQQKAQNKKYKMSDLPHDIRQKIGTYSIQDLLDNNVRVFASRANSISIVLFEGLTSLDGLHNIPDIENIQLLNLPLNNLVIKPGDFDGLSKATTLSLINNHIKQLVPEAFIGLENLTTLNLTGNGITYLQPGLFEYLPNLITLVLDGVGNASTGLTQLTPGVFKGLNKLTTLTLSFNKLRTVNLAIFNDTPNLKMLELRANQFSPEEQQRIRTALERKLPGIRIFF